MPPPLPLTPMAVFSPLLLSNLIGNLGTPTATGHAATFAAQAVPLCTIGSTAVQQQGQGHANTCFSCALSMVNELNGYN